MIFHIFYVKNIEILIQNNKGMELLLIIIALFLGSVIGIRCLIICIGPELAVCCEPKIRDLENNNDANVTNIEMTNAIILEEGTQITTEQIEIPIAIVISE